MSIGAWSDFAGATQSRVVDLIVSNLFNFLVVIGTVLMFTSTGSPIIWLGAVLAVASLIMLGWLLRRDLSRDRPLLAAYQGQRIAVLIAVAAAYLARRPDDAMWIWTATGLAILGILSERTLQLLLSKATPVAVQLPGFPEVPQPPLKPNVVTIAPFAAAVLGGLSAALGVPGWTGGNLVKTINGYRIQVLWMVEGHYNHLHIGARKV